MSVSTSNINLSGRTIFSTNPYYMLFNGGLATTNRNMPGYLDDVRITVGVGRYSGATCPIPTEPFWLPT